MLDRVTLTLRRGEALAIAGATGAGKTTLVDVMVGLLTPSAGEVTVDGQPISTNLPGWQASIGYVPQHPFLLDDSIRRNIALGIADAEIDEGAIRQALALARLDRFVASLPDGLDEATSALDPGTEREIADAIDALRGDRTLLAIAHRPSTIERCDRVILLRAGRVEATGTWSELAIDSEAFRGVFAAL